MHCNKHLVDPIEGQSLCVIKPAHMESCIWEMPNVFLEAHCGRQKFRTSEKHYCPVPTCSRKNVCNLRNGFDTHTTSIWHTCANRNRLQQWSRLLWKIDALTLYKQLVSFNHIWTVRFKRPLASDIRHGCCFQPLDLGQ